MTFGLACRIRVWQRNCNSPQCVAVRSFIFSMQMMHCNVDSLTGLLACSCCALIVAILCCSSTFDSPVSSSTSLKSISSIFAVSLLDCEASVFLRLAGFDGSVEGSLDRPGHAFPRFCGRGWEGISGGDESSCVRSTNSLKSSV